MRLLFITPGFPAHAHDDTCIPPLQLLVRELVRQGADLHVIALEYPFRATPYAWPGPEGAPVYPCNGQNRRWLRWRSCARARAFARQLFQEKKFDVLHSFWLGPAWQLGEQLAARWQTPHLCTLMGQDVLPANRYLRRAGAGHAGRLVALTPFHNDQLERGAGWRARHVIPWGIDAAELPEGPTAGPRPLGVLGVGSLLPVKNWERWLRVVGQARTQRPGLRAELIGDGPGKAGLQRLARELGLESSVQFRGALSRAEVLARMRESRVLLHTARFESFGYVMAEAAAQGCRIVGTPVGTAPALAACADTDEGLAGALLRALDAPDNQAPVLPPTIAETAAAYLNLYAAAAR